MQTRPIEMLFATLDHRWETGFVEIPADTPADKIEVVAIAQAERECFAQNVTDIALIAVYNIPEVEDD